MTDKTNHESQSGDVISPNNSNELDNELNGPQDQTLMSIAAASYAGPIPPAELLRDYEDIVPGSAEKIIGWADNQIKHRHSLEQLVTKGEEQRLNRGQLWAACTSILGLILAATLIENPWVQGVFAVVSVGGPTAAVIIARAMGSNRENEESEE